MHASPEQWEYFNELAGKSAQEISLAMIENASDIIPDSDGWVRSMRNSIIDLGYRVDLIDLRDWVQKADELRDRLMQKDAVWLCGGHTYYLRWLLKASGADVIIRDMVGAGKIYAGWSAGAVVAGPSISCFELMGDDPAEAPEHITTGLGFTEFIIIPHADSDEFSAGAQKVKDCLHALGYKTLMVNDDQVVVVHNDEPIRIL